jgi:hypothetical protein
LGRVSAPDIMSEAWTHGPFTTHDKWQRDLAIPPGGEQR